MDAFHSLPGWQEARMSALSTAPRIQEGGPLPHAMNQEVVFFSSWARTPSGPRTPRPCKMMARTGLQVSAPSLPRAAA